VNDWALLRLSKCLGKTYGHVRLSAQLPTTSDEIGIAGYPWDRPLSEGLSIDVGCHVRGVRSLTILNDCAALPGNSGSPLFWIGRENDRPVLNTFAMLEAAHSTIDLGRNVMDARDNYPDKVWNIATALCGNSSLAAAGLIIVRAGCAQDSASDNFASPAYARASRERGRTLRGGRPRVDRLPVVIESIVRDWPTNIAAMLAIAEMALAVAST
jgi:hypothetical protein